MIERPLILRGKIIVRNENEYIVGKIIKDKNVEDIEERKRYIQVLTEENINLFKEGYLGYIFPDKPQHINIDKLNYCFNVDKYETLLDYDVVEIINDFYIKLLYRDDSDDNVIIVTNQCNSNCIMCPDSETVRNTHVMPYIGKLLEQVRCIPDDTRHITITGGEPGLQKENLITLLAECKKCLPMTEFLLLSNGRIFSDTEYVEKIKENIPSNIRIAIPIYADNSKLHDSITQVPGSFKQSIIGIKKLIERNIDVEIRIVVLKLNYDKLDNIAQYISHEFPDVKMVNIMALEMTGNAFKNKDLVWVSFDEISKYLYNACITLIKNGIRVNLYNFPLCKIDERLYSIASKSITDWKINYKEECQNCSIKNNCGGFFTSTINMKDITVKPIKM